MSGKLGFGYLYDFRNPAWAGRKSEDLYAEILDAVAWTEGAGFTGAWVPEHHLADDGYMPSPLVALSAIAARTQTIRLGTAIALAPLYNPVRFATDAAVLDILAQGRLDLGLAIGYRKRETAALGVDFTKRGRMFDEWLQIVTRLWAGETVDFDGQFYRCSGARLMPPAPRGRIPLYIGGFAPKAIERVARYGDGYVGDAGAFDGYADKLREAGRDPASAKIRVTGLMTVVARDPATALEELAPAFHHVNNSYGQWFDEDRALGMESFTPMSLDPFKASGVLEVLTPDQAIAKFKALQQAIPVDHYIMMMPPGLPVERFVHYAEVFAKDVLPAFA
ncbi:MAG: LLM class flavin-dependent oxidoreductase [Sphingomonadales bacterium]|nr:LLM class flavin-dependent oxidoreductase [Sphingomonadales bacterium]